MRLRFALVAVTTIFLSGCTHEQPLTAQIDSSLKRAAGFLAARQHEDGTWRSQTYGAMKHSIDLTPFVMSCLFFMPQGGERTRAAFLKGERFLLSCVSANGELQLAGQEMICPVYTAASASRMCAARVKDDEHLRAQQAWLKLLRERQLTEALGWSRDDPEFGGWGYALLAPAKPKPGQWRNEFNSSNLSSTVFGLGALCSASVPFSDPAYANALIFVKRCQNFPAPAESADERFDDGGFFFAPDDPTPNKAGVAGQDRRGRTRFNSYGSMTADGLRALVRCGVPLDDPRVVAAHRWLERNFTASTNPGHFPPQNEELRESTYYYYMWAVAHALQTFNSPEIDTPHGKLNWANALSSELLSRQRPDGSWINRFTDAKEDDPLVATPWASAALAICRGMLTREDLTAFPRRGALIGH